MASVNKVILIGNLGKDPEVRHLEGGVMVARFPIATSEAYKDKQGNKKEVTTWHNLVLWRGLAEISEKYLKKGHSVFIEGKLRTNSYQDKDGVQRYNTEVVVDQLTMLGGGNRQNQEVYEPVNNSHPQSGAPQNDEPDDLPF